MESEFDEFSFSANHLNINSESMPQSCNEYFASVEFNTNITNSTRRDEGTIITQSAKQLRAINTSIKIQTRS
jgi:hypothetical protein